MKLFRHAVHVAPPQSPRVVALGQFDGIHVGHQRVLARLRARADAAGGEAVAVVHPMRAPALALATPRDRLQRLADAGVDVVIIAPLSHVPADAARRLGARVLVTGSDIAPAPAVEVDRISPVVVDGVRVDAARVHDALAGGDLAAVERLLGRAYSVEGRVVHGFHRGAPLGIPTANLRLRGIRLPPDGVYAVRARLGGRALTGVTNIGFNPTFGNRQRSVETHLFDFAGDLYGQRLAITFVAAIRGERKFAGVEALLAQIRDDIAIARRVLAAHGG